MAYGIIRARNLKASDIGSTDHHNARRYETEKDYPENIKAGGNFEVNYKTESQKDDLYDFNFDLKKAIDDRLKSNNVKGIRKNTNIAIEYVCTINDKRVWDNYSFDGYVSNTKKWLENRHGKNSVVGLYKHLDESNPHVHFVVVPLEEKEVSWKNKNGQGKRNETRINTRDYTGGRDKLRQLQDDYFKHLCDRYGSGKTNSLGVEIFRGTKKEHQTKHYIQQTNHKIGVLRDELLKATEELEKIKISHQIALNRLDLTKAELTQNELQENKKKYKGNWHKKGNDMQEVFHGKKKAKSKGKNEGLSL